MVNNGFVIKDDHDYKILNFFNIQNTREKSLPFISI